MRVLPRSRRFRYPPLLRDRPDGLGPFRVGPAGAGEFDPMFLSQVPASPHVAVTGIADLDPDRARRVLVERFGPAR